MQLRGKNFLPSECCSHSFNILGVRVPEDQEIKRDRQTDRQTETKGDKKTERDKEIEREKREAQPVCTTSRHIDKTQYYQLTIRENMASTNQTNRFEAKKCSIRCKIKCKTKVSHKHREFFL